MMSVNKIRVRTLADAGLSSAKILVKVLDDQPKMLSAILIGNNIVNISASSIMTVLVTDVFGSAFVGAATGVLTLLVLIFGEITPKTTATLYSESMALKFAKPIYLLMQVLTPVIFVVDILAKGVLKLLHNLGCCHIACKRSWKMKHSIGRARRECNNPNFLF